MEYGAYVGEVIRKSFPDARWDRDDPQAGTNTFPLELQEGPSFPCRWCYERITKGPQDSIWKKYLFVTGQTSHAPVSERMLPTSLTGVGQPSFFGQP